MNFPYVVAITVRFVLMIAGKRGPRFGQFWKVHIFLLCKHNEDFVPSSAEQGRLSRAGMGMVIIELYDIY